MAALRQEEEVSRSTRYTWAWQVIVTRLQPRPRLYRMCNCVSNSNETMLLLHQLVLFLLVVIAQSLGNKYDYNYCVNKYFIHSFVSIL